MPDIIRAPVEFAHAPASIPSADISALTQGLENLHSAVMQKAAKQQQQLDQSAAIMFSANADKVTSDAIDFMRANATDPAGADGPQKAQDYWQQHQTELDAGIPKGISPEQRALFEAHKTEIQSHLGLAARDWQLGMEKAFHKDALDTAIQGLGRDVMAKPGNWQVAQTRAGQLVAQSGLEPDERLAFQRQANQQIAISRIQGLLDHGQFGQAKADLDPGKGGVASLLAPDQIETLQSHVDAAEAHVRAEAERAYSQRLGQLDLAIETNNVTPDQILGANWMKPEDKAQALRAYRSRNAQGIEDAQDLGRASDAISGTTLLDPASEHDRKGLDLYWRSSIPPNATQNQTDAALMQIAAKTHMVPDTERANIRASLRSGTLDQQAHAAQVLTSLNEIDPALLRDFSQPEIERGLAMGGLIKAGQNPADAMKWVDERFKTDKNVIDMRQKALNGDRGLLANIRPTMLAHQIDPRGVLSLQVGDVPQQLLADYNSSFSESFLRTGDATVSAQSALAGIKKIWGVSATDGSRRLMAYPPERFYGVSNDPAFDAKWMREQFHADLSSAGLDADTIKNAHLVVDPESARTQTPIWRVVDERTHSPLLDKDGHLLAWKPDWQSSDAKARQEAAKLRKVEAAKDQRERGPIPATNILAPIGTQ